MKLKALLVAFLALMIPIAAACSSDDNNSGSRPSVSEIKSGMKKAIEKEGAGNVLGDSKTTDKLIDCMAKKVDASDLPNGVVRKIAEGEEAKVAKDNEAKYTKTIEKISTDCVSESLGDLGDLTDLSIPDTSS